MKMKKTLFKKTSFCLCLIFIIISSQYLYGEGWWHLYFTSPGHESAKNINPEDALIGSISKARKSFYGAFYDITSKPVIKELINAHRNGIDIKLVIEKDNLKKKETRELVNAGVPIVTDDRRALMHNKFAVIDGRIVWTGSYNLTYNDAHKNNNNAIVIESEDVADMYMAEFKEMFDYKIFGNKKEYRIFPSINKKKYFAKIGDTDINVYFSPDDNIERIILERLKKAKKSVYFLAFSFTSNRLGEEMVTLRKKGIAVYGVIEKIGSDTKESEYVKLKLEGVQAKLDKNRNRMHHKVIIIDESLVITGSYNFSKNANEKNDENIIILNNRDIAGLYIDEFKRLYN